MNSNQRSQGNNQSDNGGNEKFESASRGGKTDESNARQESLSQQSQQSASQQSGKRDS